MSFVVDRDKAGYRVRVERYRFERIDKVIALTDANPRVLELVDVIYSKRISLYDYTRILPDDVMTGTWTSITVVCSDNQEVKIDHMMPYGSPLQVLYDFVHDAVQASTPTP
jgi:hypothetical protein